ncbi:hypothetical protein [Helicobacter sp. T3_23-1059]
MVCHIERASAKYLKNHRLPRKNSPTLIFARNDKKSTMTKVKSKNTHPLTPSC